MEKYYVHIKTGNAYKVLEEQEYVPAGMVRVASIKTGNIRVIPKNSKDFQKKGAVK